MGGVGEPVLYTSREPDLRRSACAPRQGREERHHPHFPVGGGNSAIRVLRCDARPRFPSCRRLTACLGAARGAVSGGPGGRAVVNDPLPTRRIPDEGRCTRSLQREKAEIVAVPPRLADYAMHRSPAPGRSRRRLARQTRLALGLRVKQKFKNYIGQVKTTYNSPHLPVNKRPSKENKRTKLRLRHPISSSVPRISRSSNAQQRYCKGRVREPGFPPPSSSPSSIPQTSPRGLVSASSVRAAVAVCCLSRLFVRQFTGRKQDMERWELGLGECLGRLSACHVPSPSSSTDNPPSRPSRGDRPSVNGIVPSPRDHPTPQGHLPSHHFSAHHFSAHPPPSHPLPSQRDRRPSARDRRPSARDHLPSPQEHLPSAREHLPSPQEHLPPPRYEFLSSRDRLQPAPRQHFSFAREPQGGQDSSTQVEQACRAAKGC